MIDISAYTLRISQANPVQLVSINIELALDFLRLAKEDTSYIAKARNTLDVLIGSLNFEFPLAKDFNEIYRYMYGKLCEGNPPVEEVIELLEILLVGWQDVEKQAEALDTGKPKVYSGLTYGRDGKPIEYDEGGKGFLA